MFTDLISGIGVFLILAAFFAGTFRILSTNGRLYFIINICGGGLACWGSVMLSSVPFTILEATWTITALIGLAKNFIESKNG